MRMGLLEANPTEPTTSIVLPNTTPSPAAVYLASLSHGSRRAMRQALGVVGSALAPGLTVEQVPWHLVRYEHVMAIRATLGESYAPASANKILAALRGVMRAAFGLGLINADDLHRALAAKSVRGSRIAKGRAIAKRELEKLFEVCAADTAAGGARDAALLAVLYGGGLRRSEVVGLDLSDSIPRTRHSKCGARGTRRE